MELKYISLEGESRKNYYYEIRDLFNSNIYISNLEKYDPQMIDRAGQFIFLNRTCFNGLFRVNRSGQFNVPMGNYSNPMICNAENLTLVSHILQKVDIYLGDYRQSMEYIDENTFVYFDPPYRPLNQSSSFTSYSKDSFNDTNQRELAGYITLLKERNAYIMLSNSDPKNTDITDIFFDELYSNFKIHRIYARRMINSKADKRGLITELLITNY
jgi:DNA adenine methylase